MKIKNNNGFTLVELMIVILIISILMIAAIPTYLGARNRAFRNVAEQALTNSARAAAAYYAGRQSLPNASQMEKEMSSYDYEDGTEAVTATRPETIVVDNTNEYHIVTISDAAGTVLKIDVSKGTAGMITTGNPI